MSGATSYANGRKRHVRITVEQVIAFVKARGIASVEEIAEGLHVSTANARGKADAAVFRGELIRDEYSAEGQPLHHLEWRYCERSD